MKAKDSPKAHTNKTIYIHDEAFADLEQAFRGCARFERGERRGLKATRIQCSRLPKASRKIAIRQAQIAAIELLRKS